MQCTRRGFTVVELLVVIGIIAILVAIIIPVVGRSRDSARTAQCLSNQKQIFLALKAFAGDNTDMLPGVSGFNPSATYTGGGPIGFPASGPPAPSGTLPSGATTFLTIGQAIGANEQYPQTTLEQSTRSILIVRGYLGSSAVFHCPSRDTEPYIYFNNGPETPAVIFHYVFNQYFIGDTGCDPKTGLPKWTVPATITGPALTVFMAQSSTQNFLGTYSARVPVSYLRSKNPSNCVLITEDETIDQYNTSNYTESDPQNLTPLPKRADGSQPFDRIRCSPIHSRRPNRFPQNDAFPFTHYDFVNCTYVDGHSETVFVDTTKPPQTGPTQPGNKYFSVESDTAGLK